MTETFFRFHWADCPEFAAANAFSAPWGAVRSADGRQARCNDCNGRGRLFPHDPDCDTCDGTGWEDAVEGYSACESAEDLISYFTERGIPTDTDGTVIIFDGDRVGNGLDGEALAVPTRVIESMPWATFAERAA